jgi:hypothetical protein
VRADPHAAALPSPSSEAPILAPVAKNEHPQASIDWASAEVKGGDLTVALAGEPNSEWAKRVEAILDRLERPRSGWGATKVGKAHVKVEAVTAGAEEDLRHLLDSAVQQANADFAPAEEPGQDATGSEEDAAMTEAFRSFGDDGSDDG